MRLFISDIEIPLPPNIRVARTKQVNDIGRLDNRQTNFTHRIKIPITKEVRIAFDYLGTPGNSSAKPYIRNSAKLYNDNGEAEIYNGYAIINSTSKEYNVTIYDGYINFIKAIENKVLTDVGISDLNHIKNVENIIDAWIDEDTPYRYNLADYNGKMITDDGKWNADYLIPSVRVKWLWDKVHEHFNYTYTGNVFDTDSFQNLWLTYPKPVTSDTEVLEASHEWNFTNGVAYSVTSGVFSGLAHYSDLLTHNPVVDNDYFSSSPTVSEEPPAGAVITCETEGLYKFDFDILSLEITSPNGNAPTLEGNIDIVLFRYIDGGGTPIQEVLVSDIEQLTAVQQTVYISFEEGEKFSIRFMKAGEPSGYFFNWMYRIIGTLDIDVNYFIGENVNFEEAFIDYSIRDFINEVLFRCALTPFQDKYSNTINYLTHQEWLQTDVINDWSDKFIQREDEEYNLGDYAQRNYLTYKYNDNDADHNDHYIPINNKTLKDKKTIISSNIFSPEYENTLLFGAYYNNYPFWTKNPKEDGTIEYKETPNRFYMMRSEPLGSSITLKSEFSTDEDVTLSAFRESFDRLSFREIVTDFYNPIYGILNTARIATISIYLNDADINNLKFEELYFFKQEGSYFILNKVPNYSGKGVYQCEFIEVDYLTSEYDGGGIIEDPPSIMLFGILIEPNGVDNFDYYINTAYSFINYVPDSATIYYVQYDEHPNFGGTVTGTSYSYVLDNEESVDQSLNFGTTIDAAEEGWWEVYIVDGDGLTSYSIFIYVDVTPPATGSISFSILEEGAGIENPAPRDIVYRWNDFTPTSATITFQEFSVLTGEDVFDPIIYSSLSFTQDTDHTITDVPFRQTYTWYRVTITTNEPTIYLETTFTVPE